MKPHRPKAPAVKPAVPALALALLLALPNAWPQGLGGQAPSGLVSLDQTRPRKPRLTSCAAPSKQRKTKPPPQKPLRKRPTSAPARLP